jgi:drug/metabolite transporter (DMT)-like permease
MDSPPAGDVFAIAAAFSWALAVVLFKRCGEKIAPLPLNLFKNVLALLFFVPALFLLQGGIPEPDESWIYLAVSGIVGITAADTLFLSALNRLGAGMNAVVDCLYAPSMIIAAMVLLGDSLAAEHAVGGALVLSAVILGSKTKPIPGRTRRDLMTGILLGALGMVLMAVGIVSVKQYMVKESIIWVTTARLLCGTLALVPVITLRREWPETAKIFRPSPIWRIALPASFIGTVLAMGFWIAGLTLQQVSRTAILNQLSTIFIFLLAAVVLGERITLRRAAAVVLAFAGAMTVLWGGEQQDATPRKSHAVEQSRTTRTFDAGSQFQTSETN